MMAAQQVILAASLLTIAMTAAQAQVAPVGGTPCRDPRTVFNPRTGQCEQRRGGSLPGAQASGGTMVRVDAVRIRMPGNAPRVSRPTRLRMQDPASQRQIGIITLYPDGTADWPVLAAEEEGGGDGCGSDRFKFELLPADNTPFPILTEEDPGLSPEVIKHVKELLGNKTGVCGAAIAVVSGGRPIPTRFSLISGDQPAQPCPPGQRPPCPPLPAQATISATKSGIKVQTLTITQNGALTCDSPGCPWQQGRWPWQGQLAGTPVPGAQVGIMDATGRVLTSAPVQPNGSYALAAPRGPGQGAPRICLLIRTGMQPICGEPGDIEPTFAAAGVSVKSKAVKKGDAGSGF